MASVSYLSAKESDVIFLCRPDNWSTAERKLEKRFLISFSDKIMEFASVVTDGQFNLIKEGPEFVVRISEDELSSMDEWCTRTHGQTGLTEKCRNSKIKISDCDKEVAEFIKQNCPKAPIAGNSVHMDLNFMRKEMPLSTKELHYR